MKRDSKSLGLLLPTILIGLALTWASPARGAIASSTSTTPAAAAPTPTPVTTAATVRRPGPPRTPMPDDIVFEKREENGVISIWAKWTGGEQKIADTMILPKGTKTFHWADIVHHEQMAAMHGLVGKAYQKAWDESEQTWEAQGPGLYESLSPIDSSSYGPKVLMNETTTDLTLAFSSEIYQTNIKGFQLGSDQVGVNERLRKIGIDGVIGDQHQAWMSLFSQRSVQLMKNPTGDELLNAYQLREDQVKMFQQQAQTTGLGTNVLGANINAHAMNTAQIIYENGGHNVNPGFWAHLRNSPEWQKLFNGETLTPEEHLKAQQHAASLQSGPSMYGMPMPTSPLQAVQTFFQKGYAEQAPNEWTKKHAPAWDRLLRGQPLTDDEKTEVDNVLSPPHAQRWFYSAPNLGRYAKNDPHLANIVNYVKTEATRVGTPEITAQVDDYIRREEAYNTVFNAYITSDAYKDYNTKVQAYFACPEYKQWQTDQAAYSNSAAYKAYMAAYQAFINGPAMKAYQTAATQYQNTPAYKAWLIAHTLNPQAALPPGQPAYPTGLPTPPDPPHMPPMPTPPPQPTLVRPQLTELGEEAMKIYSFRQIADGLEKSASDTPLKPDPVPAIDPKLRRKLNALRIIGCARAGVLRLIMAF
jgi:hypothetical protein